MSDIGNAALLCQRHHTIVHERRLWAQVRDKPDEVGQYVVWDLTPGSYDRQLEQRRRQRAEHDPPPLTRQRLLELVAAITSENAERRLAEHDLTGYADAQYSAQVRLDPNDPAYRAWCEERLAGAESVA